MRRIAEEERKLGHQSPELGGDTFDVLMPEQVQVGVTLAIRRKTGILGLLKVSDVTAEGGIAGAGGRQAPAGSRP